MPSTSIAQQQLMGMAYSLKKGEMDPKDASQEVKDLADSMTLQQLKDFASTKHKGLPQRADENALPSSIGGMGATLLPTATQTGSGDILSGAGDAEEEYKKNKKKREAMLKTFEQFLNEMNESALNLPLGLEQFANDEKEAGKQADIYLASFDGRSFKAQSTDKTWEDGVPVTKNFTRNGYKSVSVKGQHYIIEGNTFWYFRVGRIWHAVKRADYETPPFEY
jgi:hypothetical protein